MLRDKRVLFDNHILRLLLLDRLDSLRSSKVLRLLEFCLIVRILEVREQILRNVILILNVEDLMKLFVGPREVFVDLQYLREG